MEVIEVILQQKWVKIEQVDEACEAGARRSYWKWLVVQASEGSSERYGRSWLEIEKLHRSSDASSSLFPTMLR